MDHAAAETGHVAPGYGTFYTPLRVVEQRLEILIIVVSLGCEENRHPGATSTHWRPQAEPLAKHRKDPAHKPYPRAALVLCPGVTRGIGWAPHPAGLPIT